MVESINLSIDYVPVKKYDDLLKQAKARYKRIKELEVEVKTLKQSCDNHVAINRQRLDRIKELEAENKQLRDWLIEERLPNFCTGVECGCAERVGEARRKARIKLRQKLEQALKG